MKTILKVGLVSTFPPKRCGIGIYTNEIFMAHERVGVKSGELEVITIGEGGNLSYYRNLKSWYLPQDLKEIIDQESLDVLHIQYSAALFSRLFNWNLIRAIKQIEIPIIITLHEVRYKSLTFRDKILDLIEKQIMEHCRAIIVHTPKQKKFLERKYKRSIEYIPMILTP